MVWLLVIFLLLAIAFGIGGAIEISLWFLLFLLLAALVGAVLINSVIRGRR